MGDAGNIFDIFNNDFKIRIFRYLQMILDGLEYLQPFKPGSFLAEFSTVGRRLDERRKRVNPYANFDGFG